MVFLCSLRDCKSPQVSSSNLNILADLNNAVVWMVSARPPISKSFNSPSKLLGTVLNASFTIGITINLHVP